MKKITFLKSLFVAFLLSCTTLLSAADYVKVTTAPSDWSGTYLIVCEDGNVALTDAVDAANNGTAVTIVDGKITTDANIAFTIAAINGGYSIKAPNEKYIGSTANSNELKTGTTAYTNAISLENDGSVKIVGTSSVLRYNADKNQLRFRYFKAASYTNQNSIQLYKLASEGEGGGDVVEPEPDPEEPTPDPEEPENNTEYVDELGRIVYPFGNHTDFASWTTGYSARSFDYKGATVSFESANKQSGTITDIPVTKGNYVQLELKDATKAITSVRLVCRQWNTKAQTITLNAGTSVAGLTNTNITSSNFVLETNELPINSSVVRFTFSSKDNQIGIDSIYYTIGDKEAVAIEQPTVSVVGGEKYEAFDVELTCATEGAEVYYTLNGGAETKYTAAINIATTTELKAWSVKGSDRSADLVVNYTFPTEVANIAALIADASGKNVRINGAVTVLAQTGKYLWVKDASASMLVYGTAPAEYNNGDQLIGLVGKVSTYSGAKQIVPAYFPAAVAGTTVEPTIVALTDVTANTVHQYIRLENVTYTNATTLTVGETTLVMYNNRFNFAYDGAEGDTVDVIAIVGLYNGTVQVYPISIVKAEAPKDPVNVENAVVANIYTLGGMIVAEGEMEIFTVTGQNVTDMNGSLEKGIYVVRTANATAKVVVK